MSHWNNRILRHKTDWGEFYGIHEVFYGDDGKPTGWTVDALKPYGETVDELIESLEVMLADAKKSKDDIIDYDSKPESSDNFNYDEDMLLQLEKALKDGEISETEYQEEKTWIENGCSDTPNEKTIAAMEAVERGEVFTSGSIEQLMKDLNKDDE